MAGSRCVIVASGPSAEGFTPPDDLPVIAVNGAIDWLPRADYWFSLDASFENRRRFKHKRPGVAYHVAGQPWRDRIPHNAGYWFGANYWQRVERGAEWHPHPGIRQQSAILGICKTPGCIHTGNSAWGALGLAWHLGFRDVALVGVDADNSERVEGGLSGDLSHLPLLFGSALPDMRVTSCGALTGIPQLPFEDWFNEDR